MTASFTGTAHLYDLIDRAENPREDEPLSEQELLDEIRMTAQCVPGPVGKRWREEES